MQLFLRYIVGLIIKTSSSPELMEKERTYLNKLNLILVSILKRQLEYLILFSSSVRTGKDNSHPCSYSGSGQRIGRVSSLTSSGPRRRTNRCARTTWWSSSCWARRCSTSAPARWPRPRPSTWRTRCARSSRRWVPELWLCERKFTLLKAILFRCSPFVSLSWTTPTTPHWWASSTFQSWLNMNQW